MRYIDEEWYRIKYEERVQNLAFNIKVIRALWKLKYGDYGKKSIKENNPENIYGSLERSQETLRQMELQQHQLKQKKIFDWAKRIEDKTDIPSEYLTGQEMIDLTCVGGSDREKYKEYFEVFSELNDIVEDLRTHEYSKITKMNMKLTAEKAKKMNLREIEAYVEDKCREKPKKEIKDLVSKAQESINVIKEYNEKLDNCLNKLLTNDFELRLEKQEKLYRLIYYIYLGKKSGTGESVAQIIKIMEKKKASDLKGAGEELLYKYIITLRNQLKLAESVYIVASDCKDFNNEKNLKEILR